MHVEFRNIIRGARSVKERGNALVTGGSRGLGLALAKNLSKNGWRTTIASRDPAELARAGANASDEGIDLRTAQVDVTSEQSVCDLFDRLAEDGPVELCVNNAGKNLSQLLVRPISGGAGTDSEAEEAVRHSLEAWDEIIRLCLTGVFLVGREAAASMIRSGVPGVIVNITSAVRGGAYGQSAYTASKAGVVALTRTWAYELSRYGIRVAAVSPGVIDGEALRAKVASDPAHARYMERLRETVPLGRWALESEIADAVRFVADNGYISGSVLDIDGGGLAGRITGVPRS
ncbi:SDR family NAD(P)-dependent oxidoreductase [Streptomyces sp. NPDC058701]|uniref:SDR family NAD(P)-dependent oxidoreductase n=1 Tax=Streptomyces sp. NPDC058701 TaxID=3346608 RepID=UPI003646D018